jgi:formyltetrahydrofolate-dependent phosphoribosylglycinamide formyltransferase
MAALIDAARAETCPFEIVLVTGDRADARGLAVAEAAGVKVARLSFSGKSDLFEKLDQALSDARADYVALAGFMRIIPADFIARWAGRIVNIHPSLLPKHRGLDTHRRAIEAGDRASGCSVHLVTEELDAGQVIAQAEVPILAGDDPASLEQRVLEAEHRLYPLALAEFVRR